ncbi:hypothetical protein BDD43_4340 [Mucilaginibacter gracilis]|uniref:Uncharacterized protein n=1 Tax=Mucilaginibacter gracilis TaxID=423350 RepID=A0A495J5T3_9SPHI|nr:hypothetical protein [Mucilaginibacter gracilis]RKR84113.1 hypothetical protein BDD43_4340 [Mucilaginibacter gracilis]
MSTLRTTFGNPFPNLITAASYDPFYLTVSLDSITEAEYLANDFSKITVENYKTLALVRHELTHWIDHVGTLWGQKNIVLLLNAMNAWANGDEKELWRIKTLDLSLSTDLLADYYDETYFDHKGSFKDLWRYEITCGARYGLDGSLLPDRPLLFTKFYTSKGKPITRVPVSVASILETNATFEEFAVKAAFVGLIQEPFAQAIEKQGLNREFEKLLYQTGLTVYSVVAHLTATPNHITDIFRTYQISSSLGTLLLNTPSSVLAKQRYDGGNGVAWDARATAMVKNGDIGFSYFNMMTNLVKTYGKDAYSVANVLAASGLPDQGKLELEVLSEMAMNLHELKAGPFTLFGTYLLNMGMEIYAKRGIDGKKAAIDQWLVEKQYFPDFTFQDTLIDTDGVDFKTALTKVSTTGMMSLEERWTLFGYYEQKMGDFVKICGV